MGPRCTTASQPMLPCGSISDETENAIAAAVNVLAERFVIVNWGRPWLSFCISNLKLWLGRRRDWAVARCGRITASAKAATIMNALNDMEQYYLSADRRDLDYAD